MVLAGAGAMVTRHGSLPCPSFMVYRGFCKRLWIPNITLQCTAYPKKTGKLWWLEDIACCFTFSSWDVGGRAAADADGADGPVGEIHMTTAPTQNTWYRFFLPVKAYPRCRSTQCPAGTAAGLGWQIFFCQGLMFIRSHFSMISIGISR